MNINFKLDIYFLQIWENRKESIYLAVSLKK
jgi:hypothetical protein